ncbi:MAG TPA: AI-2E family transporter [Gemmatirosa sp.]
MTTTTAPRDGASATSAAAPASVPARFVSVDAGVARASLVVLATLATVYALYLGHDFLVPVCLGVVLTALLAPIVAWLARHHVPAPAGAALTVLASLALMIGAATALEPPLRNLAGEIPRSITAARTRLARFQAPLARIGIRLQSQPARDGARTLPSPRTAARTGADTTTVAPPDSARPDSAHPAPGATTATGGGSARAGAPAAPAGAASGSESDSSPSTGTPSGVLSALGRTFGVTSELLSELIEVLLLAFFLLASERSWADKLTRAVRDEHRRETTTKAAVEMRGVVARYVFVTACINAAQGTVVALVMWALGVPSPLLWGILTFVLEFIPYLGGFVMVALLLVAGLASGGSLLHALLAPISYLAISSLQNNLVSPAAYGRGLRLNPWAILLAVMFWYAMWGVAGAFLAVPILAAVRVLTGYLPALAPVGVVLEE